MSLKILLILLLAAVSFSCAENRHDLTSFRKVGESGQGSGSGSSQKPDKKATQAALNDKMLVMIQNTSVLKSANASAVAFLASLKVNGQFDIHWLSVLKLKVGEESKPIILEESHGLGEYKQALTLTAKRLEKPQKKAEKNNKKEDLGLLVLQYELKSIATDQDSPKRSLLLVVIDLNRIKNPKAVQKSQVVYPVPDDFSLDDWIQKNLD